MALPIFQRTVTDDAGNIVVGATVTIKYESTGVLATLFSDREGIMPLSNPFTTGPDGLASFYAAPSEYRIEVTSGAFALTWRYVPLIDSNAIAGINQFNSVGVPLYDLNISYSQWSILRDSGENYICHTAQAAGTLPTDHSAFINLKFFGSYAYAVSQLAGGDASLVGFIYIGQTVDSFDYLIYPGDGRIYARGAVTGTITGTFDPVTGTATGLSGALSNVLIGTSAQQNLTSGGVAGDVFHSGDVATSTEVSGGLVDDKPVTPLGLAGLLFGTGQTLQDVTGSRSLGVNVTNTDSLPRLIMFRSNGSGTYTYTHNGDSFPYSSNNGVDFFIAGVGATYSISGSVMDIWWEYKQ